MNLSFEKKALAWALLAAVLSLGGALLSASPIEMMTSSTPALPTVDFTPSPGLVAKGSGYFGQSCSQCHADDATGDEGPNLHQLPISNARIAKTIKTGIKGEMPPFAKKYDDHQIAALVSFLRSLQ